MTAQSVFRVLALGLAFFLAFLGDGWAQGSKVSLGGDHDSSLPVEITSEELQVAQEKGQAIFTGTVIVRQGNITMTCERLQVEFAEDPVTGKNEIQTIRMFGGVTFVSQQEAAEAQRGVYVLATNTLVMYENVLVTQGTTALSSDKLTYNLDTGDGVMEGRVKTILQPNSN